MKNLKYFLVQFEAYYVCGWNLSVIAYTDSICAGNMR